MSNERLDHSHVRVCAVVPVYYPDSATLPNLVSAVTSQVAHITFVNNGSNDATEKFLAQLAQHSGASVVSPGGNVGVAAAHNLGIEQAKRENYSHVLLLDQDSVPAHDMVNELINAELKMRSAGKQVAAVGPRYLDPRNGALAAFITLEGWKIRKNSCDQGCDVVPADYIISSGSLLNFAALQVVGGMDEALFIDYVDIEWGLRAKAKGYQIFGACNAHLEHTLGDNPIFVPILKRNIPLHSPLRHYYHFRNALLLYARNYISNKWVFNDAYRLILKFIAYALLPKKRAEHIKMMIRGILHGLSRRSGKYAG